jgi:hypothetical protein
MRRQAFLRQGRAHRRPKHIEKQLTRIDGHCGFRFPKVVAGAATCVIRPPAAAPPASAVIAIEFAFPARYRWRWR